MKKLMSKVGNMIRPSGEGKNQALMKNYPGSPSLRILENADIEWGFSKNKLLITCYRTKLSMSSVSGLWTVLSSVTKYISEAHKLAGVIRSSYLKYEERKALEREVRERKKQEWEKAEDEGSEINYLFKKRGRSEALLKGRNVHVRLGCEDERQAGRWPKLKLPKLSFRMPGRPEVKGKERSDQIIWHTGHAVLLKCRESHILNSKWPLSQSNCALLSCNVVKNPNQKDPDRNSCLDGKHVCTVLFVCLLDS